MPYANRPDCRIYYEMHGDSGPALVFAHGAGGNAASWWQQVMEFSGAYRCLVFDHRGFARSNCPADVQRLELFEDDLIAVMDAAEIKTGRIICQSMGGWTGIRAAVKYPDRVEAVLLCNTPGAVSIQATMDNLPKLAAQVGKGGGGLGGVAISRNSLTDGLLAHCSISRSAISTRAAFRISPTRRPTLRLNNAPKAACPSGCWPVIWIRCFLMTC